MRTHGMKGTRVYIIWCNMVQRTTNPNNKKYQEYAKLNGGIPVPIDPRWLKFENFYADMGDDNGLEIDRIKPELGYFKENCRWATNLEQVENRRPCYGEIKIHGVSRTSDGKAYRARITFKGKRFQIGRFKTPELAELAYLSCKEVLYSSTLM